ncbi:MAG: aspartate kinase [Spirochaetes bacterium]|nr:aspartate kinase [Spirochaetota bacterium]
MNHLRSVEQGNNLQTEFQRFTSSYPAFAAVQDCTGSERPAKAPERIVSASSQPVLTDLIIMKFGGTSLGAPDRFRSAAQLIREQLTKLPPAAGKILVICSAMSGTTDTLLACGSLAASGQSDEALLKFSQLAESHKKTANALLDQESYKYFIEYLNDVQTLAAKILQGAALLGNLPRHAADLLLSQGELLSSRLLALFMSVCWFDIRPVMRVHQPSILYQNSGPLVRPDASAIRKEALCRIGTLFDDSAIIITQGFIGSDAEGKTITLGRGGSDYSASLLGAALLAREIQIWTDVDGVLTGDPRVVANARPVRHLSYDEAAELAAFGAKVLHPATILPAIDSKVPLSVRNSLKPGSQITLISPDHVSVQPVTAIACQSGLTVITIQTPRMLGGLGFLYRIFEVFYRHHISVDVIASSEISVSATVDDGINLDAVIKDLSEWGQIECRTGRALVSLVGSAMPQTCGVASKVFNALDGINIEMISYGAGRINLGLVVHADQAAEAQQKLHAAFFGQSESSALC